MLQVFVALIVILFLALFVMMSLPVMRETSSGQSEQQRSQSQKRVD